jgi:hypothetical protein
VIVKFNKTCSGIRTVKTGQSDLINWAADFIKLDSPVLSGN